MTRINSKVPGAPPVATPTTAKPAGKAQAAPAPKSAGWGAKAAAGSTPSAGWGPSARETAKAESWAKAPLTSDLAKTLDAAGLDTLSPEEQARLPASGLDTPSAKELARAEQWEKAPSSSTIGKTLSDAGLDTLSPEELAAMK